MTTYKIRSSDGVNTNNGATWATAKADLTGPWAAGDVLLLSQAFAQNASSNWTLAAAGTQAAPTQIICVDDSVETPANLATTATITTTLASSISVTGWAYIEGVQFLCGTGATGSSFNLGSTGVTQRYKNCSFALLTTSSAPRIGVNYSDNARQFWENCTVKFANAGQRIQVNGGIFSWRGGGLAANATQPSVVFEPVASIRGGEANIADLDFTAGPANLAMVASGNGAWKFVFNNIVLPTSWTGALISGTPAVQQRVEMYNSITGTSKIYAYVQDADGSLRSDTSIYRNGGAMFGSEAYSLKVSSLTTKFPITGFRSNWIERAFPGTDAEVTGFVAGASKTVSVDIVHDTAVAAGQGAGASFAFQTNEVALEVVTLDTSGNVLGTYHSSAPSSIGAASDILPSTETFVTTGMTTPVKQRLSVPIAPAQVGRIRARVIVYAPNKTLYVCPKLTVA